MEKKRKPMYLQWFCNQMIYCDCIYNGFNIQVLIMFVFTVILLSKVKKANAKQKVFIGKQWKPIENITFE